MTETTAPATTTCPAADSRPPHIALLAVIAAAALVVGLMTWRAWLCDDAYITLRTVDNWVNGYGLRYNVVERVQSYTHPLWLLLLSSVYFFTGEPYYTTLGVSLVVSVVAVTAFATSAAGRGWQGAVVGLLLMGASKAFIDYSTGGLENPLSHLLLIVLVGQVIRGPRSLADGVMACGTAALLACNRLDLAAIAAPLLCAGLWSLAGRDRVRAVLIGAVPLVGWLVFATVYYGFPLPNTAYAKLGARAWDLARVKQGVAYLVESLAADPATLATVGCGLWLATLRAEPRLRMAALSLVSGVCYVVWAGGDFMSGRFLTPAFTVAVVVVANAWPSTVSFARRVVVVLVFAVLALRLTDGALRSFLLGPSLMYRGIVDECRVYGGHTNLWSGMPGRVAAHPWAMEGRDARERDVGLVFRLPIGFFGYFAGPRVHVIDLYGLADALIARLPVSPDSRVGHPMHPNPTGYAETLRSGRNLLEDRQFAGYYDDLTLVTRGSLWEGDRWAAILRLNAHRPPWPVFTQRD